MDESVTTEEEIIVAPPEQKTPKIQTIIKEVLVEVVKTIEKPQLKGYELYKELSNRGFPQGGGGSHIMNKEGTELAYIPTPMELYNSFISGPEGWRLLCDTMSRAWIEHNDNKNK